MSSARPARKSRRRRGKSSGPAVPSVPDLVRQHPVVTAAVAVGVGLLLTSALASAAKKPKQGTVTRQRKAPRPASLPERAADRPRTHDVGAADMEFTAQHPDGKNIEFRFAWKKRPTDAPETHWETDHMGFTAARPDGKNTAFSFIKKIRPIPSRDDDSSDGDSRPGLGLAKMEFISSRPGSRDFRFTWNKDPAPAAPAEGKKLAPVTPIRAGRTAAATTVRRQGDGHVEKQSQASTSR